MIVFNLHADGSAPRHLVTRHIFRPKPPSALRHFGCATLWVMTDFDAVISSSETNSPFGRK